MVRRKWAVRCEGLDSLRDQFGARDFPINRLALISKLRPDHAMKHRVVLDLRRSLVNGLVRQGELVIFPRLSDVIADAATKSASWAPTSPTPSTRRRCPRTSAASRSSPPA
eukprot:10258767-Alexandrium_andersonii.AAC.1